MSLLDKTDKELLEIAIPLWKNLINSSNNKDYSSFVKDFSAQMLYGANEIELGKQWTKSELLVNLSEKYDFLGCLRRNNFVTVLFKQKSEKLNGDFLGRLVLGQEDNMIKIFGADAVRWFILSDSPPERDVQWSTAGVSASHKFIQRIWSLNQKVLNRKQGEVSSADEKKLQLKFNEYIFKITDLISTYLSYGHAGANEVSRLKQGLFPKIVKMLEIGLPWK